ncbi:TetR/AcrR family transcriptional regulator [Amycolatopsis ultiminotia]|uniref:TetR/AcrR family transcriptional regulator n=1 Tax=Amycolatopsis ultiminotia TaxID=543629 RepID=A0ABP6XF04_9PSEU
MSTTGSARPLRADARRNRERLLQTADAAFGEHGVEASLEQIARSAGVAIGTLYGHFPSRAALAAALLRERHDELFARGDSLPGERVALDALTEWMRLVAAHAAAYHGLAEFLGRGLEDENSELHADCTRLAGITERLAGQAREAGALGAHVTGADVTAVISAVSWTGEQTSPGQAERLLALAVRGMTTR